MEHRDNINGTTEPSVNTIGSTVGNSSTPRTDVDESELVTPDSKKRKLTSKVWLHFVKFTDNSGNDKAKCNYCKNLFVADSGKGTSHLNKHLLRCNAKIYKDSGQKKVILTKNHDGSNKLSAFKFDQNKSRKDLATMIIMHNYSFNMVEHGYLEIFLNGLNPAFKLVSRNTVRSDIINLHKEKKKNMYKLLDGLNCKVAHTTDIWTSDCQNASYGSLTCHYIDNEWILHKKILNFKSLPCPHDGESLFRFISDLLLDWNLDKKVFSMVVDNATSNDSMIRTLKNWLAEIALLPCGGDFFHVRCSAHILNLVVQDGLNYIRPFLGSIRDTVRYLARSPAGNQKFDYALKQLKLQGKKKVPMDVPHRWNYTYKMLEAALEVKEAFNRLELIDKNYKFNPSEEEWKIGKIVCDCLKLFYDATIHFSGSNFPTANVFFPDICHIHLKLREWEESNDECLRLMVGPMKNKFKKYWEDNTSCLAIAVILDPRFKMDIVEYYYDQIFGIDSIIHTQKVRMAFFDLYIDYGGRIVSENSISAPPQLQNNKYSDFKRWKMMSRSDCSRLIPKSEFDQYLEEETHPTVDKFDILTWWSLNAVRFPTLARIARDVLAVPATTVASEAAFSTGGRVLDDARSCLLPDAVEALIATADWIPSLKNLTIGDTSHEVEVE